MFFRSVCSFFSISPTFAHSVCNGILSKSKSESKSNISKFDFVAKLNVMSYDVDMSIMVTTKVQSFELRFHCFNIAYTNVYRCYGHCCYNCCHSRCRVLCLWFRSCFYCSSIYRREKFMYLFHRFDFRLSFIWVKMGENETESSSIRCYVMYFFSSIQYRHFCRTMWCDIRKNPFDATHTIQMAFTCFVAWFALKTNGKSQKFQIPLNCVAFTHIHNTCRSDSKEATKRKFDSRKWYMLKLLSVCRFARIHVDGCLLSRSHNKAGAYTHHSFVDATFFVFDSFIMCDVMTKTCILLNCTGSCILYFFVLILIFFSLLGEYF